MRVRVRVGPRVYVINLTTSLSISREKEEIFQNVRNWTKKKSLNGFFFLFQIFQGKGFVWVLFSPLPQIVGSYTRVAVWGYIFQYLFVWLLIVKQVGDSGIQHWVRSGDRNKVSACKEPRVHEGSLLLRQCIEQGQAHPMNSLNFIDSKRIFRNIE